VRLDLVVHLYSISITQHLWQLMITCCT